MTTESMQPTSITDCARELRPEQRQLLLGLPHFITYLIAGADGEIDHWELVLVLEAIDNTEVISPDFESCRESHQAELAPFINKIRMSSKESNGSLMHSLKWLIADLEKYQQLMPLLESDLQNNIRRFVYHTGIAIAQATDYGSPEAENECMKISSNEHAYLALLWEAFGITRNHDPTELSNEGNQIVSVYARNQKNPLTLNTVT